MSNHSCRILYSKAYLVDVTNILPLLFKKLINFYIEAPLNKVRMEKNAHSGVQDISAHLNYVGNKSLIL